MHSNELNKNFPGSLSLNALLTSRRHNRQAADGNCDVRCLMERHQSEAMELRFHLASDPG